MKFFSDFGKFDCDLESSTEIFGKTHSLWAVVKDVTKHHTTHKFATLYGFRNLVPNTKSCRVGRRGR